MQKIILRLRVWPFHRKICQRHLPETRENMFHPENPQPAREARRGASSKVHGCVASRSIVVDQRAHVFGQKMPLGFREIKVSNLPKT